MLEFPSRITGRKFGVIRRLRVCRFKGAETCAIELFTGANLCVGGVGSGKTRLFDALWLLSMIARGAEASVARYGWWSASLSSEIEIEVDCAQVGPVTYVVQVLQDGLFSVVCEERLEHAGNVLLHRSGGRFSQLGVGSFEIANSRFALASVVARGIGDPLAAFRDFLRGIWVLSPNPMGMVSGMQAALPRSDVECRYLAQYIVGRQREQPLVYGLLMAYLKELGVDLAELSLRNDNLGQAYLTVRKRTDADVNGMPFELLSSSEKLLMLAAFVRAINGHVTPICCIWDNSLNGLGDVEGGAFLQSLGRSFAEQGQVILLSQRRSVMDVVGGFNKIEVRA